MRLLTSVSIAASFSRGIHTSPYKPAKPISSVSLPIIANRTTSVSSLSGPVITSSYLMSLPSTSVTASISESSSAAETTSSSNTDSTSTISVESSSSSSIVSTSTSDVVKSTSTNNIDSTTSSVESTSSSIEITSTSSTTTSSETSEVVSTTSSAVTTSTTEASPTTTTDVTSSSTSSSSTSSDVPSSTSSLAPIVTNFVLTSANSVNSAANGLTVKFRQSTSGGWILYLVTSNTAWSTGTFYLEDGTSHLMVGGLYAVTQSTNAIYTVNTISSSQSYITCTSPARSGSALSCQADDGVRTQLAVRTTDTANINLYILSPSALDSANGVIDLIAT